MVRMSCWVHVADAPQVQQLHHVPQAADVVHQGADAHGLGKGHQVGDVGADIILQRQLAVLLQQQDSHDGELLGDRGHVEHMVPGHGNAVFHVGIAEAAVIDRLSPLADQHLAAGTQALLPRFKKGVDLFCDTLHNCLLPDKKYRICGGCAANLSPKPTQEVSHVCSEHYGGKF